VAKRYRKREAPHPSLFSGGPSKLPVDRPIAVYYRQSTLAQVGNISTAMQTVDMVEWLKATGWAEENIILIDMDEGISGSTKIDERPGMQQLFSLIAEGQVGAVACQDEDRLFRDVTQIQVNIFIEACRQSQVLVMTPAMVYDFSDPAQGTFHSRQFRFKSDMAAEYINTVIRGKLHRAKERLALEGRWNGPPIPPGFMIDDRKTLPGGQPNPDWRRFVRFEPYAVVLNEYFRLFLEHGGSIRGTADHILNYGPDWPDPDTTLPPDGFRAVYRFRKIGNRYFVTKTGLFGILTHAAYIGHWVYQGRVIRWNNHPGIVPVDVFMRAFNYLSEVTLDGQPNPDYRPIHVNARPKVDAERPVERPLFAGLMVSNYEGEWRKVGTRWVSLLEHYAYTLYAPSPVDGYVWSKAAKFVDHQIVDLLLNKLRETFDPDVWESTLADFRNRFRESERGLLSQLKHLEKIMDAQVRSLDALKNASLIAKVEERYRDAEAEHQRLTEKLRNVDREKQELVAWHALKDTCGPALENWPNMTADEQRAVAVAFIDRIEAHQAEKHALHIVIQWRDGTSDELLLPRENTTGRQWLPSEVDALLQLIDGGASQVEVAEAFPDRRWNYIRHKIYGLLGPGKYTFEVTPIRGHETYGDFRERTASDLSGYQAGCGDRWKGPELERLNRMLDENATKLELLEAFPHRTWGRIRAKVTELRGKKFEIPGPKLMLRDETFWHFIARQEGES